MTLVIALRKTLIILMIFLCGSVWAQDFGFGFDDEDEAAPSSPVSLKAGGEISVEVTPYIYEFMEKENLLDISLWNARLNLTLSSSFADVITSFNFNTGSIGELWAGSSRLRKTNYTPLFIDEAFLRAYTGPVNIEVGYRKLTWGKADSNGPLDVINPIDYSDLRNITDIRARKISRPMLHVTWNTGALSKLEGVFIPNFTGHRFADSGRWMPSQLDSYQEMLETQITEELRSKWKGNLLILAGLSSQIKSGLLDYYSDFNVLESVKTSGFKYFQTGLRYTATIGSADIGGQYYYGNLFRPGITISGIDTFVDTIVSSNGASIDPSLMSVNVKYTRYHQIGIDYAQVLFGYNIRAETAIFLTEDINGDDGSLQNPFIGWSLGFDKELQWGINLNIQCNENIRLFNNKIGDNPAVDAQANTDATSTRLSMQLSKKFLRDNLECNFTVIWDIENLDCYIIPAIIWTIGNLSTEFSGGFFAGSTDGELGQYRKNSFIKLGAKYSF